MLPLWSRSRPRRLAAALVLLTALIGVVCGTNAPAADVGVATGHARQDCAGDLAAADAQLLNALNLRLAARRGQFILVPSLHSAEQFVPVSAQAYKDHLALQLLTGRLNASNLKAAIRGLSKARSATVQAMDDLVRDVVHARLEVRIRCARPASPPPRPSAPAAPPETFPGGCAGELAAADARLKEARAQLAGAKKGRFFLLPVAGLARVVPVSLDLYKEYLALEFFSGNIEAADVRKAVRSISQARAATVKALNELVEDAVAERAAIKARCETPPPPTAPPSAPPAAEGAFPGGTATTMTLTIGGTKVTTDLKSNKQDVDPTIKGSSPSALGGSVALNGTLPPGWTVVVFHNGTTDIVLNSAAGGDFTLKAISPAFDAFTRPSAYVCSTPVPPVCSPAAQASISVDWDP